MNKQIQDAYIVAATRLPVAKKNGMFRNVRPDDMLAHAIKSVVAQVLRSNRITAVVKSTLTLNRFRSKSAHVALLPYPVF